jgi:hypothetical protein
MKNLREKEGIFGLDRFRGLDGGVVLTDSGEGVGFPPLTWWADTLRRCTTGGEVVPNVSSWVFAMATKTEVRAHFWLLAWR